MGKPENRDCGLQQGNVARSPIVTQKGMYQLIKYPDHALFSPSDFHWCLSLGEHILSVLVSILTLREDGQDVEERQQWSVENPLKLQINSIMHVECCTILWDVLCAFDKY